MKKDPNAHAQISLREPTIDDMTVRFLLKPIEVALKPAQKARDESDRSQDLASGLMLAIKEGSMQDNNYRLETIDPIQPSDINMAQRYRNLTLRHQDNLISFLEPNSVQMVDDNRNTLSICVCMYSEDKKMLMSTLKGIQQNVQQMTLNNTAPDEISVIVVQDGIEKMDESIVDFFEEAQRYDDYFMQADSFEWFHWLKQAKRESQVQPNKQQDITHVLLSQEERTRREQNSFKNVHKRYMHNKDLMARIAKIKKSKAMLVFSDLPPEVQNNFRRLAKEDFKQKKASQNLVSNLAGFGSFMDNQSFRNMSRMGGLQQRSKLSDFTQEIFKAKYLGDEDKYEHFLMKALRITQKECKDYIRVRDPLAYVASHRMKVPRRVNDQEETNQEQRRLGNRPEEECIYMNFFFCVKYKNAGKLNSHNWFFNGFCKELYPKYAVLLDVGLRPYADALYRMYEYLKENQNVGGVCGYMGLKIQRLDDSQEVKDEDIDPLSAAALHFVDIQRTQQVEYHLAHLIDKPFEALFDFIHVLPGAYSAYNMKALQKKDKNGNNLFQEYFKSIDEKLKTKRIIETEVSPGDAVLRVVTPQYLYRCCYDPHPQSEEIMLEKENVNLAEDRILCKGINKNGYDMHFLPDAYAEVDPVKTVHGLMGQRRRWINGSFFAFSKVKSEFDREAMEEGADCNFCLMWQIRFLTFLNQLAYIAPALFLFTVHIGMQAVRADVLPYFFDGAGPNSDFINAFVYTVDFIYVLLVGSVVFFSLNFSHNQKKFRPYIYFISTFIGILQMVVFIILIVDLIRSTQVDNTFLQTNADFVDDLPGGQTMLDIMRWLIVGGLSMFLVPVLFYAIMFQDCKVIFEIFMGLNSSLFYSPTYLIILNTFALCRIDDISWGTKGMDKGKGKSGHLAASWNTLKYIQVYKFLFWNIIIGSLIVSYGSSYFSRFVISFVLASLLVLTLAIKVVIALIYFIVYKCCRTVDKPAGIGNQEYRYIESSVVEKMKSFQKEFQQEIAQNLGELDDKSEGLYSIAPLLGVLLGDPQGSDSERKKPDMLGLGALLGKEPKVHNEVIQDEPRLLEKKNQASNASMLSSTFKEGMMGVSSMAEEAMLSPPSS